MNDIVWNDITNQWEALSFPKAIDDIVELLAKVTDEIKRQDDKWGVQDHNPHKWNTIIMEELGEVAKDTFENNEQGYYTELIQVAACAIQAILTAKRIGFNVN